MSNPFFDAVKGALSKVGNWFKKYLGTPEGRKKVAEVVDQVCLTVADIAPYAIDAAEIVASLTPTKSDDEIIALAKHYALPFLIPTDRALSEDEKRSFLFSAARKVLIENIGRFLTRKTDPIPNSVIDKALQDAYTISSSVKTAVSK